MLSTSRRTSFQRTGIGFVAGAMLEEDAIASANRGLAVPDWIPGKANAGRGIKKMPAHAA